MPRGGDRGGRRPKGSKNKATLDKEVLRERLRVIVAAELEPLIQAQLANAKGIKYARIRNVKTGKFEALTEEQFKALSEGDKADLERIELYEKDPSVQAFTDLMNRTLDKPAEMIAAEHSGAIDLRITWDK